MIHICYGLYDKIGRYTKFVGTSMTSIFENANPMPPPWIKIHILHDNTLTAENRDKLNYLVGRYGQQIKFYNVEQLLPEKISALKKYFSEIENTRFTIGTLFRLLIPDLFPAEIEKIIYLDADTIVNLDIAEFWQINLKEKILASVPECVNDIFFSKGYRRII